MPSRKRLGSDGASADGPRPIGAERAFGPLPLTTATTVTLGAVILLLAGCVVYGAVVTMRASEAASRAIRVSDDFREAQHAATIQQLHLLGHQIQPSSAMRNHYATAGEEVTAALDRIDAATDGDNPHVASLREAGDDYDKAAEALFEAVTSRSQLAGYIAAREVAPSYHLFQREADRAATAHHEAARDRTEALRSTQRRIVMATGLVLVVALSLLVLIWRGILGYQRELVREAERHAHDALHDALTGLPNRTLYWDRLAQALATRETQVAALMLDLDRFKEVNDTLGHHCGDALLVQVAVRLREVLREGDTVARFGGDEFALLLPGVRGAAEAAEAAERVVRSLQRGFLIDGVRLDLECSVGMALSKSEDDPDELLRRADVAMYKAKGGPRRVVAYEAGQERVRPKAGSRRSASRGPRSTPNG